MDSVALALFRFFSRTRQKAGAAVRAPGAAPHPHPHPHECNYAKMLSSGWLFRVRMRSRYSLFVNNPFG